METGLIGLGNLGKAIASRLITEGVPMMVWNRTREKAAGLTASVAADPAFIASSCDPILLNLFDSAAVAEVLSGPRGLLEGQLAGRTIIDTTTNHPARVLEFHALVKSRGGTYLEAPVMGSVVPASQGALSMIVSGDETGLRKVTPVLQKFCKVIHFVGAPGVATRMKLINNFVLGTFMAALAEALFLGEKAGIGREKMLEILATGGGSSGVLTAKREKLLKEDFSPHFSSAAILKDLNYLRELAGSVDAPLHLMPAVAGMYERTYALQKEGLDFSAVYATLKDETS